MYQKVQLRRQWIFNTIKRSCVGIWGGALHTEDVGSAVSNGPRGWSQVNFLRIQVSSQQEKKKRGRQEQALSITRCTGAVAQHHPLWLTLGEILPWEALGLGGILIWGAWILTSPEVTREIANVFLSAGMANILLQILKAILWNLWTNKWIPFQSCHSVL